MSESYHCPPLLRHNSVTQFFRYRHHASRTFMKHRYRMFFRAGIYYSFDRENGKRESLNTGNRDEGQRLLQAKNEGHRQPALNLQLARTYLSASDPDTVNRTWRWVFEEITKTKKGATQLRWRRAIADRALEPLHTRTLLETRAEHFLKVLERGKTSTNLYLRRIQNFALDMGWLLAPVIVKRQWPTVKYGEQRAITHEEHLKIVEREHNPEKRAFYQLCWHLGGSQGDVANLTAEDIDWNQGLVSFRRQKTGAPSVLRIGSQLGEILKTLPVQGPLFPTLRNHRASLRCDFFRKRCLSVGVAGVTLHSYRYSFAERARKAGMPERLAMEMLGHQSKAIHRAYAKNARIQLPSLEEYEEKAVNLL